MLRWPLSRKALPHLPGHKEDEDPKQAFGRHQILALLYDANRACHRWCSGEQVSSAKVSASQPTISPGPMPVNSPAAYRWSEAESLRAFQRGPSRALTCSSRSLVRTSFALQRASRVLYRQRCSTATSDFRHCLVYPRTDKWRLVLPLSQLG